MLLNCITKELADIGALPLDLFLSTASPHPAADPPPALAPAPAPALTPDPPSANAVTRLHHACQRALHTTNPLKFEFIEQPDARKKQCILSIIKPDGARRSYATQPSFTKKSDAKLEAAQIAIDMGALEFLAGSGNPVPPVPSPLSADTCVDEIERCCLEWRAGRVTPRWVPFFDIKSTHKHGCALRIQLSHHVLRIYLSDPTFDSYSEAKEACAKAAVAEAVLDFIMHGNGQTRPSSPDVSSSQLPPATTPWTLQAFYDALPRPFPEPLNTNDASEINAPGWLNTMIQSARGGKLVLSFFFIADGPPVHGCLLKLDRPGEYRASLVDSRFTKRADAKAAVCLQAMSQGIGAYIRSIISALDAKVTPEMRSFSSSLVYPALITELSKISTAISPIVEYTKDRDAFGATLIVRLSTTPTVAQVRQYTVPAEYRNKADAKVAVVCHAAEQGAVEFVRFRGESPPNDYQRPYLFHVYNPGTTKKRKQPGSTEDAEQDRPTKKRVRSKRNKKREKRPSLHDEALAAVAQHHPSGDQIHGISGPGDMGLPQSVSTAGGLGDPSQPGVGGVREPGAARFTRQMYASPSYPAVLDPRFSMGGCTAGYAVRPVSYATAPHPFDEPPPESGPSRTMPGSSSRVTRRRVEQADLEPGEVVSSAESDFSESSSRNEEPVDVRTNEGGDVTESVVAEKRKDKEKGRETTPATQSTTGSRDNPSTITATKSTASHVRKLIDYCATHGRTPSFHEIEHQGRFQVWIVIGRERFDLPTTYGSAEEGRQRVAKQVLARMCANDANHPQGLSSSSR